MVPEHIVPYLIAVATACAVTSLVLGNQFGRGIRGPVGSWRAVGLWSTLLLCDSAVAALMVGGATLVAIPIAITGLSGISRAAAIGILGPLSVRSPVRNTEINGVNHNVGVTYVYDRFWRVYQSSLDSAMTALESADRTKMVTELRGKQWLASDVESRLSQHVAELNVRSKEEKAKIVRLIAIAMGGASEEEKIRSLIVLAQKERLGSILTPCRKRTPSELAPAVTEAQPA